MTTETLVRCLEEAAELGDRFPELPDSDVLEHVSDVCKLSAYLEEDWAISRCVMQTYQHAGARYPQDESIDAGVHTAKAWGLIPKEYQHDHYAR